jgi:beta-glucosidase
MQWRKQAIYLALFFGAITVIFFQRTSIGDIWRWSSINTSHVSFPKHFLWGVALSGYQNEGAQLCPDSNWAHWEKTPNTYGESHIKDGHMSDYVCYHHNNHTEYDIHLMKELGINSVRLSVEWCNIEAQEGIFNHKALQYYSNLCDTLIQAGIIPLITLHHFTHPMWFEEKHGFEKEENIQFFVRFCKKVFETLGAKVHLWCTINEPAIYMFQGYLRGVFPPGKTSHISLGLQVLKNLLQAHTQVYAELKHMPHGQAAQIGFIHQYLHFEPYQSWILLIYEKIILSYINYILNSAILEFCSTGKFELTIPFVKTVTYQAPQGQKILDFIGLNYYSRVILKSRLSLSQPFAPSHYPGEIMTDMPYAIYAEGLYNAIAKVARIGVPIYITENGIADYKDDRRELFLKRYLYALSKAIQDGFDVRGYYYWTLRDNFEWNEGYTMKFGLYKVNFDTQERTLRQGAKYYKGIIKKSREASKLTQAKTL